MALYESLPPKGLVYSIIDLNTSIFVDAIFILVVSSTFYLDGIIEVDGAIEDI